MFSKIILIILLLTLHSALALKSVNFCNLKHRVCKGFYDSKQKYQTKCDLVECSDERFTIKCNKDICSNNKTECNQLNILIREQAAFNSKLTGQYLEERKKFEICKNNIYKFDQNDFCVNGLNCEKKIVSPTALGYNYVRRKIVCKCPNEKRFKCGKYCTKDSISCDYFTSNIKLFDTNIKKCNNNYYDNNSIFSFFRSYFSN